MKHKELRDINSLYQDMEKTMYRMMLAILRKEGGVVEIGTDEIPMRWGSDIPIVSFGKDDETVYVTSIELLERDHFGTVRAVAKMDVMNENGKLWRFSVDYRTLRYAIIFMDAVLNGKRKEGKS